jgi:5,10-methylenetetrahydromethanopterin reductase
MQVGTLFATSIDTPEHIELAERLGYSCAWVYDSPALFADPWMTLARAAERTSQIRLGVSVITPRMRHVIASASAVATLATLAPGRVDVVVGAGFTSQAMIGQKPARWAEVEEYVRALRALLRGDEVEWQGAILRLIPSRSSGVRLPADVPIWIAAHGPKGYAVGERVGDGILTNLGHGSSNAISAHERVVAQFNATVVDPGESLRDDRVVEACGPAAALHLHLGAEGAAADLPETARFLEHVATVDERHRHVETHRGHLIEVTDVERPLITPDLIRRTTATGTADEVAAALSAIATDGLSGIRYAPTGPDIGRELRAMAAVALA